MSPFRPSLALSAAFLLAAVCALPCGVRASSDGHGWHADVSWTSFDDAVSAAGGEKPIMYVISKTWCGACKNLKPKFAGSADIASLAKEFVMVSLVDDEEPADAQFKPNNAGYIPRLLFADPNGKVDADITNTAGSDKYAYFYSSPEQITAAMKAAKAKLSGGASRDEL